MSSGITNEHTQGYLYKYLDTYLTLYKGLVTEALVGKLYSTDSHDWNRLSLPPNFNVFGNEVSIYFDMKISCQYVL